jgi:predicted amidophosphoribosyltransferase
MKGSRDVLPQAAAAVGIQVSSSRNRHSDDSGADSSVCPYKARQSRTKEDNRGQGKQNNREQGKKMASERRSRDKGRFRGEESSRDKGVLILDLDRRLDLENADSSNNN